MYSFAFCLGPSSTSINTSIICKASGDFDFYFMRAWRLMENKKRLSTVRHKYICAKLEVRDLILSIPFFLYISNSVKVSYCG